MTLVEELKKRLVDEQQVRSRIDSEMCALHCEFAESELRTLHLTRAIAALADSASEVLYEATRNAPNNRGDEVAEKIVHIRIAILRKKLRPFGLLIDTAWGRGYRLNAATRIRLTNWTPTTAEAA